MEYFIYRVGILVICCIFCYKLGYRRGKSETM